MLKKIALTVLFLAANSFSQSSYNRIENKFEKVEGINIFYREAGSANMPTVVFLHGTPSSSFMYQQLIYNLAENFHCISPDYPGFGFSDSPAMSKYDYTFENIANTLDKFLTQLGLDKYSFYMQDYGAPFSFRLALKHPEKIIALITQNGNAYLDGFPLAQGPQSELMKFWNSNNPKDKEDFNKDYKNFPIPSSENWKFSPKDSPDRRLIDAYHMKVPGKVDLRYHLWHDYGSNVQMYPKWQEYLRTYQPPVLVVWGKEDKFFTTPGAIAFLKDVPKAEVHLLNAGHWASVEEPELIAELIKSFFIRNNLMNN